LCRSSCCCCWSCRSCCRCCRCCKLMSSSNILYFCFFLKYCFPFN
jgi:hypothetical protein